MKRFLVQLTLLCASTWAVAQGVDVPRSAPSDATQFEQVSRLAASGDSEALMRLGDMYWYGDGLVVDRDKADELFRRAKAAGNANATAALLRTAERQQHLAEITYWTTGINARQLTGQEFACAAPEFPVFSDIRVDATKVVNAYEGYRACYNGYVDKLFGDLPTVRRIPASLSVLMSDDEFDQARTRIDTLVATTVAELQRRSAPVLADRDRWVARSAAYITTQEIRRVSSVLQDQANFRSCHGLC
jgi:hypothetical protein